MPEQTHPSTIVALFDCDGTLYDGQMGRGLIEYAQQNGLKKTLRTYYAHLFIPLLLYKLKFTDRETFLRAAIAKQGIFFQGWTEQQANHVWDTLIKDYLIPRQRPQVIERLKHHQAQGHTIIFVSGMVLHCLQRFGQTLGANHVLGTTTELKDGRLTGNIIPPILHGQDKLDRLNTLLAGQNIDWQNSYAYADAVHDIKMMSLTGNPHAVNPDPKLLAHAKSNNWSILD